MLEATGTSFTLMAILSITTGTIVLMWLGELITERGIGNGISLLIFCGIIAGAPGAIGSFWSDIQANQVEMLLAVILAFLIHHHDCPIYYSYGRPEENSSSVW